MKCVEGGDDEHFVDSVATTVSGTVEEVEYEVSDLNYPYLETPEGDLPVRGTVYFDSPCPCYENGIGDVEFPCAAGHDGPEASESDVELDCQFMNYGVIRGMSGVLITDWAQQQGVQFNKDGLCFATDALAAINTFTNNTPRNICWGGNDSGRKPSGN